MQIKEKLKNKKNEYLIRKSRSFEFLLDCTVSIQIILGNDESNNIEKTGTRGES